MKRVRVNMQLNRCLLYSQPCDPSMIRPWEGMDEDSIERLIQEVEARPAIYDRADKNYLNNVLKKQLWNEIFSSVVPGWKKMSSCIKFEAG